MGLDYSFKKYGKHKGFIGAVLLLIVLPILLFATPPDVESKRQEIDSLLKSLSGSQNSSRVEILFKLSDLYLSISMDSSREYARLALMAAKETNDRKKIAEAYKMLGNISYYKGNYNHVISFYDSSLLEYKLAKDSFGQAKVLNNLGIIYHDIGHYQKSIDFYLKSLDYKIHLNDSLGIANTYNNIGSIHFDLGEYTTSYEYYQKAEDIYESLGKQESIMVIYNNMGMISLELEQFQKATELFNHAIEIGEKTDDISGIADTYTNLGRSKVLLGKYLEALELYNKAMNLYEGLGASKSHVLTEIGHVYIELDYYNQALEYLNEALDEAVKNNQYTLLRDVYQNLAVAYERLGNFDKAFSCYVLFNHVDDSLRNQSHLNEIQEISTKHKVEQSQEHIEKTKLELENKRAEIKRRNLIIYFIVAVLLIALAFSFVLFRLAMHRQKANTQLIHQNEEILRSQKIIKKINKALTENEEKLRSIFDVSPYSIFVLGAKNQIVDCNDTSLNKFRAVDKHDLLDKSIETFVADGGDNKTKNSILKLIEANKLNKSQFSLKRIDLTTFQAEITGRIIKNLQGEVDTYVVVINDITERLNAERTLKEAKIKAEESDRLKTAFLANMSHEIRTPMNSIVGFSNLLNDPQISSDKKNEFQQHILQSSNLLLNLIDDIIDISKIEAGQLNINIQKCKVNEIVKNMFAAFKESNTNEEVKFVLKVPKESDNLECTTDPLRLRQVLSNLLSNAVKFTHKGSIEVGYQQDMHDAKPRLKFFIKDTGIGIDKEKQDLIFERFRQVDDSQSRQYGGTGLGLAISKRLVDLLGGSIWVESELKKGSAFYFTIPFLPQEETKEEHFDSTKFEWKGKTLLIAEDENSNYELIKATLLNTGLKLVRAKNGEEAVKLVSSRKKIDLVLMDIRMPKLNGYDATRKIKEMKPDLPVVSITAYAMSEDELKSKQAGCDMYISKPIRPANLLNVINNFLS